MIAMIIMWLFASNVQAAISVDASATDSTVINVSTPYSFNIQGITAYYF